jgi:hypothetical protein
VLSGLRSRARGSSLSRAHPPRVCGRRAAPVRRLQRPLGTPRRLPAPRCREPPTRRWPTTRSVRSRGGGFVGTLNETSPSRAMAGMDEAAAAQMVEYLAAARMVLGGVPTERTLVIERFFDEAGGMQLVLHAPLGQRLNRALGLEPARGVGVGPQRLPPGWTAGSLSPSYAPRSTTGPPRHRWPRPAARVGRGASRALPTNQWDHQWALGGNAKHRLAVSEVPVDVRQLLGEPANALGSVSREARGVGGAGGYSSTCRCVNGVIGVGEVLAARRTLRTRLPEPAAPRPPRTATTETNKAPAKSARC